MYLLVGQTPDELFATLYSYSPIKDEWTQLPGFPGGRRGYGIGEVWADKALSGFGDGRVEPTIVDTWYQHDPEEQDSWLEVATIPAQGRVAGIYFLEVIAQETHYTFKTVMKKDE